jgi:hypothetical protein
MSNHDNNIHISITVSAGGGPPLTISGSASRAYMPLQLAGVSSSSTEEPHSSSVQWASSGGASSPDISAGGAHEASAGGSDCPSLNTKVRSINIERSPPGSPRKIKFSPKSKGNERYKNIAGGINIPFYVSSESPASICKFLKTLNKEKFEFIISRGYILKIGDFHDTKVKTTIRELRKSHGIRKT